jgi:hypothetical protein
LLWLLLSAGLPWDDVDDFFAFVSNGCHLLLLLVPVTVTAKRRDSVRRDKSDGKRMEKVED